MTRRRWIADEFDLAANRAALTGVHAEHLIRVLRVRVGQHFDVVLPTHPPQVHSGQVIAVENSRVAFQLEDKTHREDQRALITLLLSIFKFDRMEWAIEKAVELGVNAIVPIVASRTQKHLAAAAKKRMDRWRRIAQQAAEQSRRNSIPEVSEPVPLRDAIGNRNEFLVVLAESGAELGLREVLRSAPANAALALAIGPEGGWTEQELQLFSASGWRTASLGQNILRAETAAIAALAVAQNFR
jgi:16S rRNA (uracil1498-N3)-methyltransferase